MTNILKFPPKKEVFVPYHGSIDNIRTRELTLEEAIAEAYRREKLRQEEIDNETS